MMSIRTVNALSHFTDWTVGHVHSGALGWVGLISMGSLYFLIPKLFGRELYSLKLAEIHFWLATVGIVLYITAMWAAGIMQGLMWRAVDGDGNLTYSFVETVESMRPYYLVRLAGGLTYFSGVLLMVWNLWKTVRGGRAVEMTVPAAAPAAA